MTELKKDDVKEIVKDQIAQEKTNRPDMKMEEITPKRDHPLNCPPHFSATLKEGQKIKVPRFLIPTLKRERVI